jgi:hypothetical protein
MTLHGVDPRFVLADFAPRGKDRGGQIAVDRH